MSPKDLRVEGLTPDGCRSRQQRLFDALANEEIDGVLVCDRRHVYYFSGYWSAYYQRPLLLIRSDGRTHLSVPDSPPEKSVTVDVISTYESNRLGTLVDDPLSAALLPLKSEIELLRHLGVDAGDHTPVIIRNDHVKHLTPLILRLRRAKDDDETALVAHAVRGCEAAYARAAEIVRPGIREIDVFAEMQAAAIREVGEPLGEMGNDFQSGAPGGPPRTRCLEAGELMPLDVSVMVRGYRCDLCRTFLVGGDPTPGQQQAANLVRDALAHAEQQVIAGRSCRALYDDVQQQLDGVHRWRFPHHLGHGIGLSVHEAPRLNPHWDDHFEVGDLFTVEPGLYHEDLRAGVRIEDNYWLTQEGLRRLSNYPTMTF